MKQAQNEVPNELAKDFHSVVAEAEALIKSIANSGSDKAGGIRTSVEQSLAAAGDRLAKIREQAVGQATGAARATDEYVQQNAWQALGVAAGVAAVVGLVAGLMIARR